MTTARAAEILADHNDWRRARGKYADDKPRDMAFTPAEIGEAIDTAVRAIRSKSKKRAQGKSPRPPCT